MAENWCQPVHEVRWVIDIPYLVVVMTSIVPEQKLEDSGSAAAHATNSRKFDLRKQPDWISLFQAFFLVLIEI